MNESINISDGFEEYQSQPANACFFTGHRTVEKTEIIGLVVKLKKTIAYLYAKGVSEFHTGGALGFDTLAATQIIDMKKDHPGLKLILDLPYHNQNDGWAEQNKRFYDFIKNNADEINYSYDGEIANFIQARKYLLMRNRRMAECSYYCIAYFSGKKKSGTGYTLKFAENNGCEIINLYNE